MFSKIHKYIPAEDLKIVFFSFLYFFFIITSYYILKPIRNALLLELPLNNLPYIFLIVLVFIILTNYIYSILVCLLPRKTFIRWITNFFVINLLIFFVIFKFFISFDFNNNQSSFEKKTNTTTSTLLKTNALKKVDKNLQKSTDIKNLWFENGKFSWKNLFIILFYIWVNIFNIFMVSLFWSFTNDVYSESKGKKYYVFIGAGGMVGGVTGGTITAILINIFSVETLLLFAGLFLEITVFFMFKINEWDIKQKENNHDNDNFSNKKHKENNKSEDKLNGAQLILKDRYLLYLGLITFLYTLSGTLFSFVESNIVKEILTTSQDRTKYYAIVFNIVNIFSFFIQFIITPIVVKYNFQIGLLFTPVFQFIITIILNIKPHYYFTALYQILAFGSSYSINRVSSEIFYIPTPYSYKYKGKNFIDTFIFRLGDGCASVLSIIITSLGIFSISLLNWISIFFILIYFVIIYLLCKEYNIRYKSLK